MYTSFSFTLKFLKLLLYKDEFVQHIFDCLQPPPWDLSSRQRLLRILDPVSLWKSLIEGLVISENLLDQIGLEIQSSTDWQGSSIHKYNVFRC